ncbi:hypothetical protein, partial [Gemmiger formicilis]|uniref:hypothetical protein n=1 Tax=Gemmiger formicilis TaxID=745368 RepID=UPI001958AAFB
APRNATLCLHPVWRRSKSYTPPAAAKDTAVWKTKKLSAACETFSFDPGYLFSKFRLANHPTWGLAMLAAIPEFF